MNNALTNMFAYLGGACFVEICLIKTTVKTFTGLKYQKEYELSAVALQPSTDKNGMQDEYNTHNNISGMLKPVLMDFGNSSVIDKGAFCIRKTLEAWHILSIKSSINSH